MIGARMKAAIIVSLTTFLPLLFVLGASEAHYRDAWAKEHGGKVEVVLPDRTRCDIVTDTHAIEVDYAKKWAEAIGQSLYYALQTNKRADIVLILEKKKDYRYALRLGSVIEANKLPIDVWFTGTGAP